MLPLLNECIASSQNSIEKQAAMESVQDKSLDTPNAWHKMMSTSVTHLCISIHEGSSIFIIHDAVHKYNKNSHSFILTLM
jgi:hypothetical protein